MSLTRSLTRKFIFGGAVLSGAGLGLGAGAVAGIGLAYWGVRQMRRYNLADKNVAITGGSRGLGLALARTFLRRGAKVALLARDPEALERARQLLAGLGNSFSSGRAMFVTLERRGPRSHNRRSSGTRRRRRAGQ